MRSHNLGGRQLMARANNSRNRQDHYDLVVIGAGSAGLTAARFAARLGVRVALLERARLGGDCTWTGCVPSKSIVRTAALVHRARQGDRFGLPVVEPVVDLAAVMAHVRDVIAGVSEGETAEALQDLGIDVIFGQARFLSPHQLAVEGRTLTARKIIIASGSHSKVPPVEGGGTWADAAGMGLTGASPGGRGPQGPPREPQPQDLQPQRVFTYETIWNLRDLPRRLAVVGGGPLGCEMAQVFARLGAEVTVIGRADRLLPRDEPEASAVLAQVFAEEGITLRLGSRVGELLPRDGGVELTIAGERMVVDAVLYAVGRAPNVDGLDLEKANVRFSESGIVVDDTLRTTQRDIYAAGDCTGGYQFTHLAGRQGFVAARNALLPGSTSAAKGALPWVTFTDPEVAHVGLGEERARARYGAKVQVAMWPMTKVDRARTDMDTNGFVKLVHLKNGTILGATMVAGRAGEAIHEWALAIDHGLRVGALATTVHAYPTYSVATLELAAEAHLDRVFSGATGALLKRLAR